MSLFTAARRLPVYWCSVTGRARYAASGRLANARSEHPPQVVCTLAFVRMMKSPAFRTALIVETNYLVASVIEVPLVAAGYTVAIATDADEALAVLSTGTVSLALIDFRLQHGGPDGLVAALLSRDVPFIFCTAASLEEVHEHFPNTRVVPKPFSDEELLRAVSDLVAHAPST